MAYTKQEFKSGDKLYAAQLNAMDAQIAANEEETMRLSEEIEALKEPTSIEQFTKTDSIVTFEGVEGGELQIDGTVDGTSAVTISLEHSGRNVVDLTKFVGNDGVTSVYDNGWLVLSRSQSEATTTQYKNAYLNAGDVIRPGKKYNMYIEVHKDTQLSTPEYSFIGASNHSTEFIGTNVQALVAPAPGGIYKATVQAKSEYTSNAYIRIRSMLVLPTNCYGMFKFRIWVERADDDAIVNTAFNRVYDASYEEYWVDKHIKTLDAGHSGAYSWGKIIAKKGINNIAVNKGVVTVSGETLVSEDAAESEPKFDASMYNIPILYLTGDTSAMTKDNAVTLNYKYDDLTGTCTCKWQGSSSLNWPKKNYTIKFDNEFEAKEGWGAQKKYCFKANFIDHSHSRNVVSCKLWGEIVKSRSGAPSELKSLPNGGAIDGFPCVIVLNDEFHGLYTWNIPKDGWMFGNPKAILCADAHVDATRFKALATLNGDFELEYVEDEDNADWVLPSINRAIQAVIDSDGSDLDTTVNQYIDIASAIDYYIHTVDEAAADGTDKNYILVTFDGVKWYFSAYDRDTVYGLDWDGKKFYAPNVGTTYENYANLHRLMELIYNHKRSALKARAISLRNGVKSEANVTNAFTNFASSIPSQILDEDAQKWPTIPATTTSNVWQILNWYRLRRAYLDPIIDSWT